LRQGIVMGRFANSKLVTKLSVLVAVFLAGFLLYTVIAWETLEHVKVNGPIYREIAQGKDLIADVLPPPEYVIESYLLVLQTIETHDKVEFAELTRRGGVLRRAYDERHALWSSVLPPGAMREALLSRSHEPAVAFFEIRDREFIAEINAGNLPRAREIALGPLKSRYEEHRRAVDDVVRMASAANQSAELRASDVITSSTRWLFGVGALIVALSSWLAWVIGRSLVNRLQRSSVALMSTATQIAATSREQQATVNGYTASTTEIAAATKEISATSRELLNTLEQVSLAAAGAASLAASGRGGLDGMDGMMQQLSGSTATISLKLSVIREKANDINMVVTTITKVADQTNLLSVNAAIEAEKAGEYGLGFLVVAREIRRLADQSAVATLDIEQMVRQMQGAVSTGVMEMDKFTEQVRQGVQSVAHIGAQLGQIIERVQDLSASIEPLNDGMRSQSEGATQISEAMTQLTDGARQTATSLKEFNDATDSLRDVVSGLKQELTYSA
jgi:methyl-accepting chemotaxis protein WspA